MLALENHRRRFDNLVLNRHSGSFHHRATEIAAQHFGAAVARERLVKRGDNRFIKRSGRPFAPVKFTVIKPGLHGVAREAETGNGVNIFMQQAAFQQLAHQHRYAARGLEVVNIRRAVRVEARQQRHHVREIGEIIPVNDNPCRPRHGHQVHGMVGGPAGCQQRDNPVDHYFFIKHFTQRHPLVTVAGQTGHLAGGGGGQRFAQRRIRMHE